MAIGTFYEVDVVSAVFIIEGGVHFFHVQAAVGKTGMASGAGSAGLEPVLTVAGHAAEAFMYADGSAIVAGMELRSGQRCMALITEGLTLVGTDFYGPGFVQHFGKREVGYGNVAEFAAIEEAE